MPSITIRNVPEEIHRRLRIRAARHGRSMEAELRHVLAIATGLGRAQAGQAGKTGAGATSAQTPDGRASPDGSGTASVPPEVLVKLRDILKVRPASGQEGADAA